MDILAVCAILKMIVDAVDRDWSNFWIATAMLLIAVIGGTERRLRERRTASAPSDGHAD